MILAFRKHGRGLFPFIIRLWTRSPYNHCEVVFSGLTMISAIEGRGVRLIHLLDALPAAQWDVVEVPMSVEQENAAYAWSLTEIGAKYDWLGILLCQVFKFGREHPRRWFCSEFCAAILLHAGLLLAQPPYKYSPGTLYKTLTAKGPRP